MSRIYGNIGFTGLWNGLPVRIVMIGTLTAFQWLLYVCPKTTQSCLHVARFWLQYHLFKPGVENGDADRTTIDTTRSKCTLGCRPPEVTS